MDARAQREEAERAEWAVAKGRLSTLFPDEVQCGHVLSSLAAMPVERRLDYFLREDGPTRIALAPFAAGTGTVVVTIFQVKFGQTKREFVISGVANYVGICTHIEDSFPILRRQEYKLSCRVLGINIPIQGDDDWRAIEQHPDLKSTGKDLHKSTVELIVESLSCGFSSCTLLAQGHGMLGIDDMCFIPEHDEEFESANLEDIYDGDVAGLLSHLTEDMQRRIKVFGPLHEGAEYTNREFISPILLTAATIAGNVQLRAEYQLMGVLGNGPVDYVALYERFSIVITEAKHTTIESAIPQNLAQLAASRDQYVFDVLRPASPPAAGHKRKFYEVDALARVPTSAIISKGNEWLFLRFEQHPKPSVKKSSEHQVLLVPNATTEALAASIRSVVEKVVGMLLLQKAAIDAGVAAKTLKKVV